MSGRAMFPALDQHRGYVSRNGSAPVHCPWEAYSVAPFTGLPGRLRDPPHMGERLILALCSSVFGVQSPVFGPRFSVLFSISTQSGEVSRESGLESLSKGVTLLIRFSRRLCDPSGIPPG